MSDGGVDGTTVGTGTAGQVLKTNSAGNGVEWGTDVGGKVLQVKVNSVTVNANLGGIPPNQWTSVGQGQVDITPVAAGSSFYIQWGGNTTHGNGHGASTMVFRNVNNGGWLNPLGSNVGMSAFYSNTNDDWENYPTTQHFYDTPTYTLGQPISYSEFLWGHGSTTYFNHTNIVNYIPQRYTMIVTEIAA
jgi:hypothetical protein